MKKSKKKTPVQTQQRTMSFVQKEKPSKLIIYLSMLFCVWYITDSNNAISLVSAAEVPVATKDDTKTTMVTSQVNDEPTEQDDASPKEKYWITFRHEVGTADNKMDLYFIDETGSNLTKTLVGTMREKGGELRLETLRGALYGYEHANNGYPSGELHFIRVPEHLEEGQEDVYLTLMDPTVQQERLIYVECTTTTQGKRGPVATMQIVVHPDWGPRGAGRFLDLVRTRYFNQCPLHRVVPQFLTQFGIAKSHNYRVALQNKILPDDFVSPEHKIPFREGIMAFAGNGPQSRKGELFVVMPDTPQHQLDSFGTQVWETPFAEMVNVRDIAPQWNAEYGDMPPWGNGPDPEKLYHHNRHIYMDSKFPNLDLIERCDVLDTKPKRKQKLPGFEL